MANKAFDWFLNNQIKLMALIGSICSALMLALGEGFLAIAVQTVVWLVFAFVGGKLYSGETTETWLDLSWSRLFKNILGLLLILAAWLCFVGGGRGGFGVVVQTIAAILLKAS